MNETSELLRDLAIILITAGIVTVIFKLIKQPVVLGYIVAGFLISPHFIFLPSVADMTNVNAWADIGVIFLLFTLGINFSFKKLMDVGGTAFIATSINMLGMVAIGHAVGQILGWSNAESIFLGCMLSMSSTTIVIKSLSDMGLQNKKFAGIVFGMLVVEDLGTILMMVLLPTIAISQNFEGTQFISKILVLIFFILVWFIGGIYIIPSLYKKFRKYLNDETLLVISIGLCLGMVLFATSVGFSSALGAFLMGSILSETLDSKRIAKLMQPVKDLFGAIFFVSVGMMIIPSVIVHYASLIILLAAVFIVFRIILGTIGVLASGQGLKTAVQAAVCLTQIGEFSFIIATLGIKICVLQDFIYPIIVCVAVLTMFVSPYLIKSGVSIYNGLSRILPSKWHTLYSGYAANTTQTVNSKTCWKKVLKDAITTVVIYSTLALAIFLLSKNFLMPLIKGLLFNVWGSILAAAITLLVMSPFLNAIVKRHSRSPEVIELWNDSYFNKGALIALNFVRILPCIILILMVLVPLFPKASGIFFIVTIILTIAIALSEGFSNKTIKMEKRFFDNLNSNEIIKEQRSPISKRAKEELLTNNIHLSEIEVPQNAKIVGKTLSDINFQQTSGVYVISIIRGSEKINIPDGNVQIFPFDKLIISGTDDEIQQFESVVEKVKLEVATTQPSEASHKIELSQYALDDSSPLIGKVIKDSGIKEKTGCAIVGINTGGPVLEKVSGSTRLNKGDVLWLAGEQENLDSFEQKIAL